MGNLTNGDPTSCAARCHQIPELDGVRAGAILLVAAYHIGPTWVPNGSFGVDVFFVLSGYLITGILFGELLDDGRIALGAFYARRALRLIPALVVALVIVFPLVAWVIGEADRIWFDSLAALFYITDVTGSGVIHGVRDGDAYWHTWSLAVEEQFYLVWPFVLPLLLRVSTRRRPMVMWAGVFVSLALWVVSDAMLGFAATYYLPSGHLASLAVGAALAIALAPGGSGVDQPLTPGKAHLIAIVAALAVGLAATNVGSDWVARGGPFIVYVGGLLGAGALVLFAVRAHGARHPLARLLRDRRMRWLGTRSYGVYLFHGSLAHVPAVMGIPKVVAHLIVLSGALILAEVSFRFVEAPIRSHGRRALAARARRGADGDSANAAA